MILTLFKQEPAVKKLPLSVFLALAFTVLMTARFRGFFVGDLSFEMVYVFAAYVATMVVIPTSARNMPLRLRISELERSLPITFRHVIVARLSGLWLALFGSFVAASLPWLIQAPNALTDHEWVWLFARGFLVSGVCAAIMGAYRPARLELNGFEAVLVPCLSLGAALLSPWFASGPFDLAYAAILVALITYLWRSLPATSWAPSPVASSQPEAATSTGGSSLPVRLFGPLRWTIIRSSLLRPQLLFLVVFSGAYAAWAPSGAFWALWFAAMVPWMALRMGLNVVYGIDSLPVRRERVLRIAGLTTLALLVCAATIISGKDRKIRNYEAIGWGVQVDRISEETWGAEQPYRVHVKVPAAEWRLASDPAEALITAPWGEQVTPTLHPILPSSSTFIYNPFDVQSGSSGKFLAWQVRRALSQVHGLADHSEDKLDAWIATVSLDQPVPKGVLGSSREASSAAWGYRVVEHSQTPNGAGFSALCVVLIWILVCAFALRPNVPSTKLPSWWSKLPKGMVPTLLLAPIAYAFVVVQKSDSTLVPVLVEQAHLWLDAQLGSSPVLWALLVLAVSSTGYAFLAWRIQRIEVPPLFVHGWKGKALPIY